MPNHLKQSTDFLNEDLNKSVEPDDSNSDQNSSHFTADLADEILFRNDFSAFNEHEQFALAEFTKELEGTSFLPQYDVTSFQTFGTVVNVAEQQNTDTGIVPLPKITPIPRKNLSKNADLETLKAKKKELIANIQNCEKEYKETDIGNQKTRTALSKQKARYKNRLNTVKYLIKLRKGIEEVAVTSVNEGVSAEPLNNNTSAKRIFGSTAKTKQGLESAIAKNSEEIMREQIIFKQSVGKERQKSSRKLSKLRSRVGELHTKLLNMDKGKKTKISKEELAQKVASMTKSLKDLEQKYDSCVGEERNKACKNCSIIKLKLYPMKKSLKIHKLREENANLRELLRQKSIDVSGIDVSGIDISGIDVSGIDVSGIDVSGPQLGKRVNRP